MLNPGVALLHKPFYVRDARPEGACRRRSIGEDAHATLLAIDDEPDLLAIVAKFACRFGFTVVTPTDARAARAALPGLKPDAVSCSSAVEPPRSS